MKIFAALYAADYTVRKLDVMGSFVKGFVPMMAVILLGRLPRLLASPTSAPSW